MSGRSGVPGPDSDAGCLGKDVVAAIGDLAQLLDGFIQVAALDRATHGGAVESAVEQLVLGGQTCSNLSNANSITPDSTLAMRTVVSIKAVILIDLPMIWMQQKRSRSPVRTHMPFLPP